MGGRGVRGDHRSELPLPSASASPSRRSRRQPRTADCPPPGPRRHPPTWGGAAPAGVAKTAHPSGRFAGCQFDSHSVSRKDGDGQAHGVVTDAKHFASAQPATKRQKHTPAMSSAHRSKLRRMSARLSHVPSQARQHPLGVTPWLHAQDSAKQSESGCSLDEYTFPASAAVDSRRRRTSHMSSTNETYPNIARIKRR